MEEPRKRKDPPQCLNCQEFGHTKKYCRLPSVCVKCGDIHKTSECSNSKNDPTLKRCGNCGGNHTANYRGCPVFIQLKKTYSNKPDYRQFRSNDFPQLKNAHIPTQNAPYAQNTNNNNGPGVMSSNLQSIYNFPSSVQSETLRNDSRTVNPTPITYAQATRESQYSENPSQSSYRQNIFNLPSTAQSKTTRNDSRTVNPTPISYVQTSRESQFSETPIQKSSLEASIEVLIQTMNNFMSNMQVIMQELLRNQGMLIQAFSNKQ